MKTYLRSLWFARYGNAAQTPLPGGCGLLARTLWIHLLRSAARRKLETFRKHEEAAS